LSRFDAAAYLRLIRGQTSGLTAVGARTLLTCAAAGYGAAIALRNGAFESGWLRVHRLGVPVVSVGNLTVGGTGKTPMVEWLARWFRARRTRVVIVSRGYRREHGLNDEGRVLEENLPDVPHLQDRDRVRAGQVALEELDAELLMLDDGFQHRRLARDLDLVLIDALEPFGLGQLLPRGLLREPLRSLRRADLVILTRADLIGADARAAIQAEAERRAGPLRWVEARHAPLDLIDSEGSRSPLGDLAGQAVAAFCGIGNPEGFRQTLLPLCQELRDFRVYPDHHGYSAADVASLQCWAGDQKANLVLTTQKDLVKLRTGTLGAAPLRALRIGLEIVAGEDVMDDALARLLPESRRGEPV
jgi:tetraacyldisaccharide 4'-kinase